MPNSRTLDAADYSAMDEALDLLRGAGPELRNGLTNHAPMAAEAMCALGRPQAVIPWVGKYRRRIPPEPARVERVRADGWESALGDLSRHADWVAFFDIELKQAPWREVLERWVARLAPGIVAAATHGVIRTGHAARALADSEKPLRMHELASGLAYWAATYRTLPTAKQASGNLRPSQAILDVAVVPRDKRKYGRTIVSSLASLQEHPPFAGAFEMIDTRGDPGALLSDMTATFARVYLGNAREILGAIAYIHCVTGPGALRMMMGCLDDATARTALRYAWQASCAIYSAFGFRPVPRSAIEPPAEDAAKLIDMAIATGDEHAIKFTEACLRENALAPDSAYLAAARHAIKVLGR
jgi:Questin oxidase-like